MRDDALLHPFVENLKHPLHEFGVIDMAVQDLEPVIAVELMLDFVAKRAESLCIVERPALTIPFIASLRREKEVKRAFCCRQLPRHFPGNSTPFVGSQNN